MENIIIIGDVHRKIDEYNKIIQGIDKSIQVGDFGLFREHNWHLNNIDFNSHKINFGNHDDYNFLNEKHSLGNYSKTFGNIFSIRGAKSIDSGKRVEGVDWWSNEELSYNEMNIIIDEYLVEKPRIVITHDCPNEVRESFFNINDKTLTSNGLQAMFEGYQPDLWIFGHHHRSKNELINGTRFICLSELETYII